MLQLYCEKCHNLIGERGPTYDKIRLNIRGKRHREYVVTVINSVQCDWCQHVGPPLPSLLTVAQVKIAKVRGSLYRKDDYLYTR